jgi:SAM-dependent methyltransferase
MNPVQNDVLDSKDYWERQARRDPLWAILSDAAKREGKWNVARFFQTGASEIATVLFELEVQQVEVRRGTALDFGCGVGRLTQALAAHFERVVGVDVSPTMRDLAERCNQHPSQVRYVANQAPDLRIFEDHSFDIIVSSIVLQHIQPDVACAYVREFLRLLRPGGVAVFQLPSHRRRLQDRPVESATRGMPDDAYCASISVDGLPRQVRAGSQMTLQIEVTNLSVIDWIQRDYGVFSVGDHWFDGGGLRMLTRDDGRTRLPLILRARETCRVPLTINVPTAPGDYQCEFDVAHEGVLWFHDRDSAVVRREIRVGDSEERGVPHEPAVISPPEQIGERAAILADTGLVDPGEFPMYGVPLDTVVRLVAGHGATLVHVENDRSCGDDWVSYRYFVRTSQS